MHQAEAYLTTRREEETAFIGEMLGRIIETPVVVALEGELGAGKTVFARGAARGLEVSGTVASPTFVLLRIHAGRLPLYHFDFYRLTDSAEAEELGFCDYLPGTGAAFVEWAGRLPGLLPPDHLLVRIERFHDDLGEGRRIWFEPRGSAASLLVGAMFERVTWRTDGALNLSPPGEA